MKLAAIDSSGLVASVAILQDDILLAEYSIHYKKTHSQTLLPMLEEAVRMTELDLSSLDAIAVSAGPGSFTGLRIGSATAKGLGLALDIPLIEVGTLEAMAYQLSGTDRLICPMMDARRGQVYTGLFRIDDAGDLITVSEREAVEAEEMIQRINEMGDKVVFLGDGAAAFRELIEEKTRVPYSFAPAFAFYQRAGALAVLAARYYREGRSVPAQDHKPDYLRLSQAERERLEKEKNEGVTFRRMKPEDADGAARIEQELFSKPWSREGIKEGLEKEGSCYVVAVSAGRIVGYCGLYSVLPEGFINQVGVSPDHQGKGIGTAMLAYLIEEARRMGVTTFSLEVRVSNRKAIALYESLGFEKKGIRPGFYEAPAEDALIMSTEINDTNGV